MRADVWNVRVFRGDCGAVCRPATSAKPAPSIPIQSSPTGVPQSLTAVIILANAPRIPGWFSLCRGSAASPESPRHRTGAGRYSNGHADRQGSLKLSTDRWRSKNVRFHSQSFFFTAPQSREYNPLGVMARCVWHWPPGMRAAGRKFGGCE
jgi:hypothetical protein